jgi:DNA-binding IscR family transcriptional regulator
VLVECLGNGPSCRRSEACATRDVWMRMQEAQKKVLSETTVADLLESKTGKELQAFSI